MSKSHVAGWGSDAPTPAQLKEFFSQIESGRITKQTLQGLIGPMGHLTVQVKGINRSLSDAQAAQAAGLNVYGDIKHAVNLPVTEGDSETITFIPVAKTTPPDTVDSLVVKVGKYASFKGLCKYNQDNPGFAKSTPHFIQGKDIEGRHSCAAFSDWGGERNVRVNRSERDWRDYWFVAVVPASHEDSDT